MRIILYFVTLLMIAGTIYSYYTNNPLGWILNAIGAACFTPLSIALLFIGRRK
jgi:hypothetical protein